MEQKKGEQKKSKFHYGFVVAGGLFLLMFPASLVMNAASIFYTPVTKDFGVTMAEMGLNMTILMVVLAVFMPVISRIFNKYDTRLTLTACVIINALCFAARASANSIWVFYVTSVFQAFAFAPLINLSIPILINNWFSVRTATLIGVCGLAQGLGGVIFSSVGGLIIQNYGWRAAYWIWSLITVVIGLPLTLFVIRKFPSEKGLLPLGYKNENITDATDTKIKLSGLDAKKAIKTPAFILLSLAIGLFTFANQYNFYMNAYVQSLGISAAIAGVVAASLQLGNMICGKIVLGAISDKSPRMGAIFAAVASIIALPAIVLIGGKSVAIIAVCVFLFGTAYGAPNLVGPVLTKEIFGPKDFNKIWPNIVITLSLMGAFGSTIWGLFIDKIGYRTGMFLDAGIYVIIICCVLGALAIGKKYKSEFSISE